MTGFLISIKHRFPAIWRAVEWANGKAMRLRYPRLGMIATEKASSVSLAGFRFSPLQETDLTDLHRFLMTLPEDSVAYFNPHAFTLPALRRLHRSGSFVMLGVRQGDTLVGYHFLRCFASGRCFHGLVVSPSAQGRGIGTRGCHTTIADRLPGSYLLIRCQPKKHKA